MEFFHHTIHVGNLSIPSSRYYSSILRINFNFNFILLRNRFFIITKRSFYSKSVNLNSIRISKIFKSINSSDHSISTIVNNIQFCIQLRLFFTLTRQKMTIDIQLLREEQGGNPEKVRESERRRFRDPSLVDKVISLDKEWRKCQYNMEQKKKELGKLQTEISNRKKFSKGQDKCEDLLEQKIKFDSEIDLLEEIANKAAQNRNTQLGKIGNILDDEVPVSQDEDKDNKVISVYGTPTSFPNIKYQTDGNRPHFELLEMIGGVNFQAGRDVFGSRGYFLTGPAVLLNQALINYGIAFLMKDNFVPIQPPFMMKKEVMGLAAELKDYDDVLYKVTEGPGREAEDRYLIATSEQPITALYRNQVLPKDQLPLKYTGVSSCFRKEAGSSGRDIRGIFRCHQFEKIEQFVICEGHESEKEHQNIIGQAEKFYQSLGLPYQVVTIVSGEINDAASKKYDLEGWFPGEKDGKGGYRELVSASNCTCFQSRRMNTTLEGVNKKSKEEKYPHMLNSTLCATGRGICCILENYQTPKGICVPRVLQPYMAGIDFIPFLKEPPKK